MKKSGIKGMVNAIASSFKCEDLKNIPMVETIEDLLDNLKFKTIRLKEEKSYDDGTVLMHVSKDVYNKLDTKSKECDVYWDMIYSQFPEYYIPQAGREKMYELGDDKEYYVFWATIKASTLEKHLKVEHKPEGVWCHWK